MHFYPPYGCGQRMACPTDSSARPQNAVIKFSCQNKTGARSCERAEFPRIFAASRHLLGELWMNFAIFSLKAE
jgi:hypothetical protein